LRDVICVPNPIYLDFAATTPIDERVLDVMVPLMRDHYANPNSLHAAGRAAHAELESARVSVAEDIGASRPSEVVFTGGGTESDNTAVFGLSRAVRRRTGRGAVVVSAFEHKAVLQPAELLVKEGFELRLVRPRSDGVVHPQDLSALVDESVALVSVMHVNNELGTVQPIKELAAVAHEHGALFHSDTVQSVGKIPLDVTDTGVDAASFSAHKIYGPKGIGVLYLKRGGPFAPLLIGGGQESGRRSGTQNVAGAAAFAKALRLMLEEREEEQARLCILRDRVIDGVLQAVPDTELNGAREHLAPHIANLMVHGVEGEAMLLHLDELGIMMSTGSACSAKSVKPSHVLLAIGRQPQESFGSLRVSVGRFTTDEHVEYFLRHFPVVVDKIRALSGGRGSIDGGQTSSG